MITLYGISNCDTVRKARKWLEANQLEHQFHDFRRDGLSAEQLSDWCKAVGIDTLLNKRGTTWRQLPASERDGLDDAGLLALMLKHPALIKRPVLTYADGCHVGFKENEYASRLLPN